MLTEFGAQAVHIAECVARRLLPPFSTRLIRIPQHTLLVQAQPRLGEVSLGRPEFGLDEREFILRPPELLLARAQESKILLKLVACRLQLRLGNLEPLLRVVIVLPTRLERIPSLFRDIDAFMPAGRLKPSGPGYSSVLEAEG